MELLSFTFVAGETKRWERSGRYVEVIDASAAFDIYLSDANGGRVDYATSALSGIFLEGQYAAIEMKSATAQTVTLLVTDGRGGSRRQPGNVRVIDEITEAITLATGGLPLVVAAWTANQLVAPASNVRGIIVRRAYLDITSGAGAYCDARITASKTAPTSTSLPAQQFQFVTAASSNGTSVQRDTGLINKLIPAGFGIYAPNVVNTAAAANMAYLLQYEIL